MNEQMTIFDFDDEVKGISDYKIRNKVRLIELFAGICAQAMAALRKK